MKKTEILALITGFSAIIVIVFYLITKYEKPIFFLEPIWWIRIPEIILGIFSSIVLFKMIFNSKK